MDVCSLVGLPAGFRFFPEDTFLIVSCLLQCLRKKPLRFSDIIICEDDPYSTHPQVLLARNGRNDVAYFFARRMQKHRTGSRYNRQTADGGMWRGQKRAADDDCSVNVRREIVKWSKYNLTFSESRAKKSAGWVMQEYEITNTQSLAGIKEDGLVLCCVKRTDASKKRQR